MFARCRSLLAACAAIALTASCTQAMPGTPGPDASVSAPSGLERFYQQKLDWGACAPFARTDDDVKAYADTAFTCAKLTVPLDYAKPDGATAQIGVLRQKAKGRKIGSLLFNPGGPGASGMSLVTSLSPRLTKSPLAQRFDLVGFDPRGVGSSTPAIDCLNAADWVAQRADLDVDPSPAGVAQTEKENQQYTQDCVDRSGGAAVLGFMGTREVAKDLDVLRAALGDAKLSYLGYSYGTRIGTQYAEDFPQNVRAMVLDGALDPTESSTDRTVKQIGAFQQAFQAFADDCAKKPTCPLGTDPRQATAAYQALIRPLIDAPVRVGGRTLSYTDATTGTIEALYVKELWPALQKGIAGLVSGKPVILLLLADLYYGRQADGSYDNDQDAFNAISCMDEQRITDRAVVADMNARSNAAAPFQDPGLGAVGALDPCAFWPVPPTSRPHVPDVKGLPSTLVISTTGDPATPYQAGVALAKELSGSLLTYEGTQHTVALRGVGCIDDIVNAYLIDATKAPDGVRCT